MKVRTECCKCGYKWDLEMKPMETITCPNCKTVYDALKVVNDPENLAELEKYNKRLLEGDIDKQNKIALLSKKVNDLQKENNDLKTLVAEGDCLMDNCREMSNKIAELEKENAELKAQIEKVKHYLDYDIPHDLINEATTKIWRMLK